MNHEWLWPQKEGLMEVEEEVREGLRRNGGKSCGDEVGLLV